MFAPQQPSAPAAPAAPAAPPSAPGGAPPGIVSQLPPQVQRFIDPNNALQAQLLQRLNGFSQQEAMALVAGISPPALAVLKKLLPEIGFVFDAIEVKRGGGASPGGAPGGAPMPQGGPPPAPTTTGPAADAEMRQMEAQARPPGAAFPRPQTKLGGI